MNGFVLGASVAGSSHRTRGLPNQDRWRGRVFGSASEWLALAVADGAGSASHAEVGATLTCGELLCQCTALAGSEPPTAARLIGLFATARDVVVREANCLGVAPRELACTALFALLGPAWSAFAQVGDGAIIVAQPPDAWRVLFWPEPAEYANVTDFLTDERFAESLRIEVVPEEVATVALLTDGLQRLALDFTARTGHPGFFGPLRDTLHASTDPATLAEPLRAFLDSPAVNARTDDDKTLALGFRCP